MIERPDLQTVVTGASERFRLSIEGLSFARRRRPVLQDIRFHVEEGEVVCLIGPNGSGKSTLLRCLAGALTPDSGPMIASGVDLRTIGARDRARVLTYCPQDTPYAFAFTVAEFIGLVPEPGAITHPERIRDLVERFDLTGFMHRSLLTLSGGERQRAAIARALAQECPLVLLDEPTAHLDLHHQKLLLTLLREETSQRHRSLLVVLHDLNLASMVADRLLLLDQGRLFAAGPVAEVLTVENIAAVYHTNVRLISDENNRPLMHLSH